MTTPRFDYTRLTFEELQQMERDVRLARAEHIRYLLGKAYSALFRRPAPQPTGNFASAAR